MKVPLINGEKCGNCKFAGQHTDLQEATVCRRYPPTVSVGWGVTQGPQRQTRLEPMHQHNCYPIVDPNNWCGEHKPKIERAA